MKRIFLFTMIVISSFFSCENQKDDLEYEDYQSNTLLRQIKASEEDMQVITYYNTGNVFEHVQLFSYHKFLYNNQNQLTKIEIALSFNPLSCAIIPGETFNEGDDPRLAPVNQIIDYNYLENGNIDIKVSYSAIDDMLVETYSSAYEYNNDKVVKINLFNPQGQLNQYYTYMYDEKGNVSQEEYYFIQDGTDAILQSNTINEYDDKNNPFKVFAVEGTPGINTNMNNIIRQVTTYYYNGDETSYSRVYTYEYNDLGYPVKANNLEYIYGEGD